MEISHIILDSMEVGKKHKQLNKGKKDTEPSTHSSSVNGLNSAGSSGYA